VHIALDARIDRQLSTAPFSPSSSDLIAGAHIYLRQCAVCHGTPVHASDLVKNMYPPPPQLWKKKNEHGSIGVSDDAPGRIYWEVKNGIRLTGMPSFVHLLDDKQLWQVSLLVKQAGRVLPSEATATLDSTSEVTQPR
jgi:thiosulfate dehydrogenase